MNESADMLDGWSRITIADKPADIFTPPNPPRFAVLFLHAVGLESPADRPAYTAALAQHGLACCAPHGMRSWWANRVCSEFDATLTAERHLLENVLPWMREQWQPHAVAATGISMGGQGAVRLGFKYPDRFPVVASVAGAFDYHERHGHGSPLDEMYPNKENCRQDTAILHLSAHKYPPHIWFACDPTDTEWYRGNDRLHEKLMALGIPHVADLEMRAGGHTWSYFDAMAEPMFRFIADALTQQSRRLV